MRLNNCLLSSLPKSWVTYDWRRPSDSIGGRVIPVRRERIQGVRVVDLATPKYSNNPAMDSDEGLFIGSLSAICSRSGWTVLRMLRVLQMNLFERKTLQEVLNPSPADPNKNEPQMRLVI